MSCVLHVGLRLARLLSILSEFIEANVPHAGQDIFSFKHGVFTKEPPILYFRYILYNHSYYSTNISQTHER